MFDKYFSGRDATRPPARKRACEGIRASRKTPLILVALAAGACQTTPPPRPTPAATVEVVQEPGWRSSATAEDISRIEGLPGAWQEALGGAQRRFGRQIDAEGELLQPNAALNWPIPTPGNYLCRWIRFGTGEGSNRAFTVYRSFFCYVGDEDDILSLTKQTGSDRPSGYLFEDGPKRMVFLGSLARGNEELIRAYGQDPTRNLAGVFERIGSFRYRLVIPRPQSGAILEVVELTPAPVQND